MRGEYQDVAAVFKRRNDLKRGFEYRLRPAARTYFHDFVFAVSFYKFVGNVFGFYSLPVRAGFAETPDDADLFHQTSSILLSNSL